MTDDEKAEVLAEVARLRAEANRLEESTFQHMTGAEMIDFLEGHMTGPRRPSGSPSCSCAGWIGHPTDVDRIDPASVWALSTRGTFPLWYEVTA